MKKLVTVLLVGYCLVACNNSSTDRPDVSGIGVQLDFQRFDREFFAIDSNAIEAGLSSLAEKYPILTPIFLQNIIGVDPETPAEGVKQFFRLSAALKDTINEVFKNTGWLEKQFEQAFQHVKYYFPGYSLPSVVTVAGPLDALAQTENGYSPDFLGPQFLGISLQFYLGKNYSVYSDPYFINNVAPAYRSRRFSKEYIISDAMQLITDDLFPDKSRGKPLVEQMIERGKQWWLLDKFLPFVPDSIKTGYTQQQIDWCRTNEGLIWSYITKNEDLYSLNPATLQIYIGEGPFTQGFSQELSPGNIGQWIGWQIIKKFVESKPGIKPEEVMNTEPRKILDEAKYKPK